MKSRENKKEEGGSWGDDLGALIMERMARPKKRMRFLIARLGEAFGGKPAEAKDKTTTGSTEGTFVDPNVSTFWTTFNTVKNFVKCYVAVHVGLLFYVYWPG
ncbi:hypothetical protein HDV00_005504 [Rhizophlyctis rosea]|nr:hypothetical protein HDV00_005504 [Rhizophlyctis rosea]